MNENKTLEDKFDLKKEEELIKVKLTKTVSNMFRIAGGLCLGYLLLHECNALETVFIGGFGIGTYISNSAYKDAKKAEEEITGEKKEGLTDRLAKVAAVGLIALGMGKAYDVANSTPVDTYIEERGESGMLYKGDLHLNDIEKDTWGIDISPEGVSESYDFNGKVDGRKMKFTRTTVKTSRFSHIGGYRLEIVAGKDKMKQPQCSVNYEPPHARVSFDDGKNPQTITYDLHDEVLEGYPVRCLLEGEKYSSDFSTIYREKLKEARRESNQ